MELAFFEKVAISNLLSVQIASSVLTVWLESLEATKRDFNGYGYYLHIREQPANSLGTIIQPDQQKLTQGIYTENNDTHHIGFILWLKQNGDHQLECHPYDDKPIHQSILNLEVTIK